MLPPAPGLFSITTCWPHISESRAPRMRPIPSMPPPGVNGTTSFTTRLGKPGGEGAWAAAVRSNARTGAAAIRGRRRRRSMMIVVAGDFFDDFDLRFALGGRMIELAGHRHGGKQRGEAAAAEHGSNSL